MVKHMIILWWTIIVALALTKDKDPPEYTLTADSPIVHEKLGLVLLPSNILAQSTSTVFQSVFLNLESPRPPPKACNLPCSPDAEVIREMLVPLDGCWIQKMAVVRAGVLEELSQPTAEDCFIQCLLNGRCKALTYDDPNRNCILRSGNFYRVNAIDELSTSSTARMDCLFDNHQTSKDKLCGHENELFTTILDAMIEQHDQLVDRYFTKFEDVKKAYDLNLTHVHSTAGDMQKRGLDWSDFDFLSDVPVLGHFYEILKSPSENRKLKDHLRQFSSKFQQFVTVVSDRLESTRKFNQEVLELVDAGFAKVFKDIKGLKCDIASLASLTVFQQTLKLHSSKLDELFYATKHGKLKANLPQTLGLSDLELIIAQNPNFKDTLFKDHPEILYRVGDLYLLDATKNSKNNLFHFLLTSPKLVPGSLFRTYHPVQVPIASTENEMCFLPVFPRTVIIQKEKLVAADITDCYEKEQVILCQQDFADSFSPTTEVIPCLNGQPELCTLEPVSCEPKMVFTKAGALVFSKGSILGMPIGETTKLTILDKEDTFSYFFSWTDFKMIQSRHKVIYSPNNRLVVKNLTWKSQENFLDFSQLVKTTADKLIANNISKLKEDLDNVTSIVVQDYTPDFMGLGINRKTWTDFTGWFSLIFTLLSTATLLLLCCYKRIKQNSRIARLVLNQLQLDKTEKRLQKTSAAPLLMTEEALPEPKDTELNVSEVSVKPLRGMAKKWARASITTASHRNLTGATLRKSASSTLISHAKDKADKERAKDTSVVPAGHTTTLIDGEEIESFSGKTWRIPHDAYGSY